MHRVSDWRVHKTENRSDHKYIASLFSYAIVTMNMYVRVRAHVCVSVREMLRATQVTCCSLSLAYPQA